jgi:hypothetical protein
MSEEYDAGSAMREHALAQSSFNRGSQLHKRRLSQMQE